MRAPAFWWRPSSLAAALLHPAALVYGAVAGARMRRAGARAEQPVICVGNLVAGGAGKTPTALALARLLAEMGERPAFLSRGYGGSLAGPVRVDPGRHGPEEVGDEPLLLARVAPTIVARDRPAGARLAAAEASVIVMDDGLQNPSLVKDLALAVVDGATGIGNGRVMPAGPLRAPLSAQWPAIDALVLVGNGAPGEALAAAAGGLGKPVLRARIAPDPASAARLAGRPILAFAGIGRPEKFFASLEACGAEVRARRAFPDHHSYAARELSALAREAAAAGLTLVTTEKDRVRMGEAAPSLETLPVILRFSDDGAVMTLLHKVLNGDREAGAGSSYRSGEPFRNR